MQRYALFAAWCVLGISCFCPRGAEAESGNGVGVTLSGIHDSNGLDVLAPGCFVRFNPLFLDMRFGHRVWQVTLEEDLPGKDFSMVFRMRARKEDLSGGLIVNVPWKKVFTIRASAIGTGTEEGEENALYSTLNIGGEYSLFGIQKFSLDLVQDIGRKDGTMLIFTNKEQLGSFGLEQGILLTRFAKGGMFVRVRYKGVFAEVAHYEAYDYHDFDRTEASAGVQFNF